MTIFGAVACSDAAVVWADTLVTRDSNPLHECTKLIVNAAAGLIGVGCGSMSILRAADMAVLESEGAEQAANGAARALRAGAIHHAQRNQRRERFSGFGTRYAVTGWCPRRHRFVVYEMHAADMYVPFETFRSLHPMVSCPWGIDMPPLPDVQAMAAKQTELLAAAGQPVGRLTVATINATGIHCLLPTQIPAATSSGAGRDAEAAPDAPGGAPSGAADASTHPETTIVH